MTLEQILQEARTIAFNAPVLVEDGNQWRVTTPQERKKAKAEIVARAESYARWRFQAYQEGVVARQW